MPDWSRIFEPFDFNLHPTPAVVEEIPETHGSSCSLKHHVESRISFENVTSIGTGVMIREDR